MYPTVPRYRSHNRPGQQGGSTPVPYTTTIHDLEGEGGAVMAAAELNRWMREIIITNQ